VRFLIQLFSNYYYHYHYTLLTASFPGQPGEAATKKVKPVWIQMRQEMLGFCDAVASSGPYAINVPLLQTDNHTNTSSLNFYGPEAVPDAEPTVSKH